MYVFFNPLPNTIKDFSDESQVEEFNLLINDAVLK